MLVKVDAQQEVPLLGLAVLLTQKGRAPWGYPSAWPGARQISVVSVPWTLYGFSPVCLVM